MVTEPEPIVEHEPSPIKSTVRVENNRTLEENWKLFVSSEKITGTDLSLARDVRTVLYEDNLLKLVISDQFIYDNLHSHLNQLISEFQSITGSGAKIELIKKQKVKKVEEKRELHPIEKKIVEEFKAFEEKTRD